MFCTDHHRHTPRGAATEMPGGVVLHQRGADRRLAALPQLLADPSARLVVHRPERRAVVRLDPRPGVRGQRQWAKVVRPEQLERLIARAAALDGSGMIAPQLLDVREDGVTVWSDVAGTPLSDLLDTPSVHEAMGHVAVVVHRLHTAAAPPTDAEAHTAGHEIGVLQRWLGLLEHYDPEAHRRAAPLLGPVATLLTRDADTPGRLGTVHRDLHDGQLLVDGPRIGLLDPDTLVLGEPELDLANLAAHLRLAACAGRCGEAVPEAAVDALLDAYGRDRVRPGRFRAYLSASLLRLVAVHAIRPATRAAALGLTASVEEVLRHDD